VKRQRTEIHPAWRAWAVALLVLPLTIGAATAVASIGPATEWYEACATGYAALHALYVVVWLPIADFNHVEFHRPRASTPIEQARDALDEEFA
jgi:hypothetical protein